MANRRKNKSSEIVFLFSSLWFLLCLILFMTLLEFCAGKGLEKFAKQRFLKDEYLKKKKLKK